MTKNQQQIFLMCLLLFRPYYIFGTKHEETPRSEKSFGFFGMNEQIWSKYEALVK